MKINIVLLNSKEKKYSCKGYGWKEDKGIVELYNKDGENNMTIYLGKIAYWYIEE